jgi:hypothetical protein
MQAESEQPAGGYTGPSLKAIAIVFTHASDGGVR